MSKILFRFELGEPLKEIAGEEDNGRYEVYGVPGRDGDMKIAWSGGSVIYGREEVEGNIKSGNWIKVIENEVQA